MPEFRYTNPITCDPALSLRDHQIVRVGDAWYMTGTSPPVWSGPNPGVRLFRSTDLLHWTPHAVLIDAAAMPDGCRYNGRFWAPEIHRAHGRFWLTINSGHGNDGDPRRMCDHAIWLFVADQIAGPYALVAGPIGRPFKNDASLFTDDDGRTHLYCSGGGLWQAEFDLSTGRLTDGRDDLHRFCAPADPGLPDWMSAGIEGPFVVKRAGVYHLFFSAWTRGYEVGVMTAASPLGPWTLSPQSPILAARKRRFREPNRLARGDPDVPYDDTPDPYVEAGHCAVFDGPDGNDWLCCHYFREGSRPIAGGPVLEYEDAHPQLGIEPLALVDDRFIVATPAPTWTEQVVRW